MAARVIPCTPQDVKEATAVTLPAAMAAVDQAMKRGFAFLHTHELYWRSDGLLNVYRRYRPVR